MIVLFLDFICFLSYRESNFTKKRDILYYIKCSVKTNHFIKSNFSIKTEMPMFIYYNFYNFFFILLKLIEEIKILKCDPYYF
jgi:hypothetical protein